MTEHVPTPLGPLLGTDEAITEERNLTRRFGNLELEIDAMERHIGANPHDPSNKLRLRAIPRKRKEHGQIWPRLIILRGWPPHRPSGGFCRISGCDVPLDRSIAFRCSQMCVPHFEQFAGLRPITPDPPPEVPPPAFGSVYGSEPPAGIDPITTY